MPALTTQSTLSADAIAQASERVATRFSRLMNAAASPYGVLTDLYIASAVSAVPLVLFVRQALAQEWTSPITWGAAILSVAPAIVTLVVGVQLRGSRDLVVNWMAKKPFAIENMNALLNGLGDEFDVVFRPTLEPIDRENIQPLLDQVSDDSLFLSANSDDESDSSIEADNPAYRADEKQRVGWRVRMKIGVIDSSKFPLRSNYLRYERFCRIVDEVLVPLHAKSAIEYVRII